MFLDKAQECVDLMLPVFATSPSGEGHVAVVQPLLMGSPQMFCCPEIHLNGCGWISGLSSCPYPPNPPAAPPPLPPVQCPGINKRADDMATMKLICSCMMIMSCNNNPMFTCMTSHPHPLPPALILPLTGMIVGFACIKRFVKQHLHIICLHKLQQQSCAISLPSAQTLHAELCNGALQEPYTACLLLR